MVPREAHASTIPVTGKTMMTDRLMTECLAGCGNELIETDMVVAEGPLL
jgi:hypothetical protein